MALSVFDSKPVNMITTGHRALQSVEYSRKHPADGAASGQWTTVEMPATRLNVINDYNHFMDGVDVADQLRTKYVTKVKSNQWWHPIFWALINTAIYNMHVIHKLGMAGMATNSMTMTHAEFHAQLAESLVALGKKKTGSSSGRKRKASTQAAIKRPPDRTIGQHLIVQVKSEKAKTTPQQDCMPCKEKGTPKARSVYECNLCNVGLHPDCFFEYHTTQLEE